MACSRRASSRESRKAPTRASIACAIAETVDGHRTVRRQAGTAAAGSCSAPGSAGDRVRNDLETPTDLDPAELAVAFAHPVMAASREAQHERNPIRTRLAETDDPHVEPFRDVDSEMFPDRRLLSQLLAPGFVAEEPLHRGTELRKFQES